MTDSPSFLSRRPNRRSSSPGSRAHFSLNHHGESAFWVPSVWMGKSGYTPVHFVEGRALRSTSTPPKPWLLSKPCFFSHNIISRLRPSAFRLSYVKVCWYWGFLECFITRVFLFCSHCSPSRRYVFTYVSGKGETIQTRWIIKYEALENKIIRTTFFFAILHSIKVYGIFKYDDIERYWIILKDFRV